MEYVIEKNVPMPERSRGKGLGSLSKALIAMDVGDSLFMDKKSNKAGGFIAPTRRRFPDREYVVRNVEGGCRVWRVA